MLVLRPGLSTDSFQRYDANYSSMSADGRRLLAQDNARHIKAGGVTKLMVDGEPKYEIHSELTNAQMVRLLPPLPQRAARLAASPG